MSQLQKTASVEPERCLGGKEAAEADAVIAKRRGPPRGHNGGPEIRPPASGDRGTGADGLKRGNTELKSSFP